jgi:hypothetical protein
MEDSEPGMDSRNLQRRISNHPLETSFTNVKRYVYVSITRLSTQGNTIATGNICRDSRLFMSLSPEYEVVLLHINF